MKILVVSAHFPPNFVSGGTLVPLRSALELSARGHDVQVFAGWIGSEHPAGEAFDGVAQSPGGRAGGERGRAQVPVRWFTTNDALDWTGRRNVDNPAAAAEFARTVEAFGPDLVHFHSMQGLGAGLLLEADRRAVPFVVTAHDFWWWCGRQFLCDRDYHPCCPVVTAGVCPCAVDRAWLDERNRWTTGALQRAARVITVSESAAAVLRANGVVPEQVTVIDNPVEGGTQDGESRTAPRAPARPTATVRFAFAGGPDPMKGLPVLCEAFGYLEEVGGWTADLYGVDGTPGGRDGTPPAAVRSHPAFPPEELSRVLSHADVLVVPSVMQETYSILTREALAAGVPVVTTTCLGPEEVVHDRVNGLVVPQDDPGALAAAMTELVEDPGLLERLKRAAHAGSLTSVGSHTDRLESVYVEAVRGRRASVGAARPEGPPLRRRISRVLFVVGIDGAPLRYRAHLPAEALTLLGVHTDVRHYRHPDIVGLAATADVVVLYRVPATHQIRQFVAEVHARGTPVLFDVDDLIFDPDLEEEIPALKILSGGERALWLEGVERYRTTMELCDAFIGSTEGLCDHARSVTGLPAFRFANGVGVEMGRLADAALRHGAKRTAPRPVRIGYLSGTDTHDRDWASIEAVVLGVLEGVPEAELWLVGKLTPSDAVRRLGDRLRVVPFQPWTSLPELLATIDVNLAPLEADSRFNEAKSAVKWLEAALSGTPTIATPTQPFREVVDHDVNGMLADGPEEWAASLGALLADGVRRRRLGQRARRDALLRLGPWTQGWRYLDILESVELRDRHEGAWAPVLLDEPFEPITLDPYGLPAAGTGPGQDGAPLPLSAAGRLAVLGRRAAGSVRRHGVMGTGRLAVARAGPRVRRAISTARRR